MTFAELKIGHYFHHRSDDIILMKTNDFIGTDLRINAISLKGYLCAWFEGHETVTLVELSAWVT